MKARQKWDLLVLNSKGFVNFVMLNLRNFEKFFINIQEFLKDILRSLTNFCEL